MTMKSKEAMTAIVMALVSLTPAAAAEDLSSFGDRVEEPGPAHPATRSTEPANKLWPADVCAEIQQMEKVVISGARPPDRGMFRIGLLMLEQLHCGIDASKKIAADQAVLEEEQRKSQRDFEENKAAAQRAASRPREPIVVRAPKATPESSAPDPSPTLSCFTTRLGGGMSTTTCR
ncbi:hypothetical protein [Bradyrhizobium lablabi]|uniref:hypothetical protein n=1 Tax=Bradyrhizobium lablabi TaxID=722472 RepID=UPI001BA6B469|nr:hypothetical protein [Bradyrhizobium lablabi]MBR0693278.1 hypothetical protein [Bradyrhizobium lablabi]